MNANITVLKDESLGGIEREYREVKRRAGVGERILIVNAMASNGSYANGDVLTVKSTSSGGGVSIETNGRDMVSFVLFDEYVTLEPSDTVRIGGVRFRIVDRKAAVGERVIIINDRIGSGGLDGKYFRVGDIATNVRGDRFRFNDGESLHVSDKAYRVLEPVESAEAAPLSAKPAPDQAAEIIAKLTTRVASLERRVTLLEIANAKPIPRRVSKPEQHPSFTKCAVKSPQEIRDDIVKRAKEDVSDLRKFKGTKIPNDSVSFWPHVDKPTSYFPMHTVEYVVNRDKRTVVAIIRCTIDGKITRGIAKCAPGDVFNVWIGKAISLRRALGLEIPEEYVSAPQPTEVRVGDVVTFGHVRAYGTEYRVLSLGGGKNLIITADEDEDMVGDYAWGGNEVADGAIILDDSRESDSAEPRKEVA